MRSRGEVERRALLLRDLRDGRVDLVGEKASLSAVSAMRSKRSVSSRTAASPRARTSSMIAATASSTSGASSRFIDRSAANRVEIRIRRVQEYRHGHLSAPTGACIRLASLHLTAPIGG
jgi:hypothetical protein